MEKKMWRIAVLLLALTVPGIAAADVILELRDEFGDPFEAEVGVGESFEVNVRLRVTGGESVIGIGFWLSEDSNAWASQGGGFAITDRTVPAGSPFSDLTTATGALTVTGQLDPVNDRDIGALTLGLAGFSGNQVIMNLTLTSSPITAKTYNFSIRASPFNLGLEWIDSNFVAHDFASGGVGYTVILTPEPSSAVLVSLGLLGLLGISRRTRRIQTS